MEFEKEMKIEWIKCADRLPEEYDEVYFYGYSLWNGEISDEPSVFFGFRSETGWWATHIQVKNVSLWTNLDIEELLLDSAKQFLENKINQKL